MLVPYLSVLYVWSLVQEPYICTQGDTTSKWTKRITHAAASDFLRNKIITSLNLILSKQGKQMKESNKKLIWYYVGIIGRWVSQINSTMMWVLYALSVLKMIEFSFVDKSNNFKFDQNIHITSTDSFDL